MLIRSSMLIFSLLIFACTAKAQAKNWNKLLIEMPEGWSTKQKNGTVQYSNYNIQGQEPFSISLFGEQPFTGKPDTLFAYAWNLLVTDPPMAKETPRWRRFYTEDGILVQQGFIEFPDKDHPLYRQLNVFVLTDSFQACLIETTTTKAYKQVQYEWQERLLGVKEIATKKKNK